MAKTTRRVQVEYVPIDDVFPYPNNPRIHEDLSVIVESIENFDMVTPILVDTDYQIIDGHGRWESAKNLGKTEIPVIVLDVDEKEAKAIRLTMNRSAEVGNYWDMELVGYELQDIGDAWNMNALGWEEEQSPDDSDDGGNDDLGGKPEVRCECPNCHKRFFLSECIVKDDDDDE